MTGQDAAREYRVREWAEKIADRARSGQTVVTWCAEHGIAKQQYYYWLNRVRKYAARDAGLISKETEPIAAPAFVALPAPHMSVAAVTIHIGDIVAEIQNGADAETVESVLRTLSKL